MATDRPPNSVETLPSGIRIEYWDAIGVNGEPQRRRYAVNGERCVNVTTILGVLAKDALLDWAANLAFEGKRWREVRDEAGKRGHSAHHLLLQVMTGEGATLADLPDEHRPWGQAGFKWVHKRRPTVLASERMVASVKHGYAGRFDLLATVNGCRTLCDFKSVSKPIVRDNGKSYPPYVENLLQLDLYQGALVESGYESAEQGLIVRLGPDGNYDETYVELDPARGLGILAAYRCRSQAEQTLKKAAKAAQTQLQTDAQIEQLMAGAA